MKLSWRQAFAVLSVVVAAGCATPTKMGLSKTDAQLDLKQNSLLLMTLRIDHPMREGVTPMAQVIYVEKPGAKEAADRFNFMLEDDFQEVAPNGRDYLVSMALPPGRYEMLAVTGMGNMLPIFPGRFVIPLVAPLEVKAGTVTYIGRIEAKTRDRAENEFRAGPLLPLLDQAATGWSGSTWEVAIRDSYEVDLPRFRSTYPALGGAPVGKQMLPPFDRSKAHAWWEKN